MEVPECSVRVFVNDLLETLKIDMAKSGSRNGFDRFPGVA